MPQKRDGESNSDRRERAAEIKRAHEQIQREQQHEREQAARDRAEQKRERDQQIKDAQAATDKANADAAAKAKADAAKAAAAAVVKTTPTPTPKVGESLAKFTTTLKPDVDTTLHLSSDKPSAPKSTGTIAKPDVSTDLKLHGIPKPAYTAPTHHEHEKLTDTSGRDSTGAKSTDPFAGSTSTTKPTSPTGTIANPDVSTDLKTTDHSGDLAWTPDKSKPEFNVDTHLDDKSGRDEYGYKPTDPFKPVDWVDPATKLTLKSTDPNYNPLYDKSLNPPKPEEPKPTPIVVHKDDREKQQPTQEKPEETVAPPKAPPEPDLLNSFVRDQRALGIEQAEYGQGTAGRYGSLSSEQINKLAAALRRS